MITRRSLFRSAACAALAAMSRVWPAESVIDPVDIGDPVDSSIWMIAYGEGEDEIFGIYPKGSGLPAAHSDRDVDRDDIVWVDANDGDGMTYVGKGW